MPWHYLRDARVEPMLACCEGSDMRRIAADYARHIWACQVHGAVQLCYIVPGSAVRLL